MIHDHHGRWSTSTVCITSFLKTKYIFESAPKIFKNVTVSNIAKFPETKRWNLGTKTTGNYTVWQKSTWQKQYAFSTSIKNGIPLWATSNKRQLRQTNSDTPTLQFCLHTKWKKEQVNGTLYKHHIDSRSITIRIIDNPNTSPTDNKTPDILPTDKSPYIKQVFDEKQEARLTLRRTIKGAVQLTFQQLSLPVQ